MDKLEQAMQSDMLSGYGIDSPQNIIDTVLDLCRDYE